jgi:hypothetical protein
MKKTKTPSAKKKNPDKIEDLVRKHLANITAAESTFESALDFVVSVSEQSEQTSHAVGGQPILAHWPYDDPTKVQGTPGQLTILAENIDTNHQASE